MSSFKPWLWIPPALAHELAPVGLELACLLTEQQNLTWQPMTWNRKGHSLRFRNRLGVAAGVDKNAESILEWRHMGAGFIEVGTVTPEAQGPNPGRIIDRSTPDNAVWNKMGFPNLGARPAADHVREALNATIGEFEFPIFVNIGKNRNTPLELAAQDYLNCIDRLTERAYAPCQATPLFVINISSPNTAGLRDLFQPDRLRDFLGPIADRLAQCRALGLLKLSPDLDDERLGQTVATAVELDLDGFVTSNTTLARKPGLPFPTDGGVSGLPLRDRSRQALRKLTEALGSLRKDRLIISVGGVMTPDEVYARLHLGADLVETYTALIFEGPSFFKSVSDWMSQQA